MSDSPQKKKFLVRVATNSIQRGSIEVEVEPDELGDYDVEDAVFGSWDSVEWDEDDVDMEDDIIDVEEIE